MKKVNYEECIRNVRLLLKSGVHPAVILFALSGDGIPKQHRKTVIRWAKMGLEKVSNSVITIDLDNIKEF